MPPLSEALRKFRLVPSVSPRTAAGYWRYQEHTLLATATSQLFIPRNQDRALLAITRLAGAGVAFISLFPTVNGTTHGMQLPNAGGTPLVIDFAAWGPAVGDNWYAISTGVNTRLWALAGIYEPH